MKKQRILSLLLAASLLLSLAACSGGSKPGGDPTGTAAPSAEPATDAPAAAAFSTDLAGYEIECRNSETGETAAPLTGWIVEGNGSDPYETVVLNVLVKEKSGAEVFRFDMNTSVSGFIGPDPEGRYNAVLRARAGDVWVFTVNTSMEDDAAVYFYDAAKGTLTCPGAYAQIDPCGDYLAMTKMNYSGETPLPVDVFDADGNRVYAYESALGYQVYNGWLYILGANGVVQRTSVSGFGSAAPAFAAEPYAAFPRYNVSFDPQTPGTLVLYPRDGGASLTCKIEDAAAFADGDLNENTAATGAVKESCDYFTVTLPDSWAGKYYCEKDEDEITFFHKAAQEAAGSGSASNLLFSISLFEASDDVESMMFGDASYEVCRLQCSDGLYEVLVYENVEPMFVQEYADDLHTMLAALNNIENRITPVDPNGKVILFDYWDVTGEYAGTDSLGNTYRVNLYMPSRNVLNMMVLFTSADGGTEDSVYGTARMFGNNAFLYWDKSGDDPDAENADNGNGILKITDTGMLFSMYGNGDSWTTTDDELKLTKQQSYAY